MENRIEVEFHFAYVRVVYLTKMDHNARIYQNSPSQQLENFGLKNPLGTRPCYLIADTADTMDYLKKFLSFP